MMDQFPDEPSPEPTALVLGGYGLIGAACVHRLKAEGFKVIGMGRSMSAGLRSDPNIEWRNRDIAHLSLAQWKDELAGIDVVINASGALQTGARDNLTAIHETAVRRLVEALHGSTTRLIHISAAGVSETATTDFMRSKMRGDKAIMSSGLDWIILRPTLVFGQQAYGGTSLLRASAAIPLIGMSVLPEALIQTVSLDDVAKAVALCARGEIPSRTVADLTEENARSLETTIDQVRNWLGLPPWGLKIMIPKSMVHILGRGADMLGWLGWRSPLRMTALKALEDGIMGDPSAWIEAGGSPCRAFNDTLASIPSTTQERWFARLYLLLPLAISTLALFWIASGLIGLASFNQAAGILTSRGITAQLATFAVIGGSVADMSLGVAILYRPWARRAALGMALLSIAYLVASAIWTADIWLDPLGPLVKVIPGIMLAIIVAALLEDR